MITMANQFAPVDTKTGEPIRLAMQKLWLTGRVTPFGAHLQVVHTFCSSEKKPLEVVYVFSLPADAAMRRFLVEGKGFRVKSQLQPVKEAERHYEKAISQGHLGALARQYRDGIVNLSIGNIRPGESVVVRLDMIAGVEHHDDGYRFAFPFTMAPCYHPQARVGWDGHTGEVELPDELFDNVLLPPWLMQEDGLHRIGFDLQLATAGIQPKVSCLTFPFDVFVLTRRKVRVCSRVAANVPNNDLIIDVQYKSSAGWGIHGADCQGKERFVAVVPSTSLTKKQGEARRVVFVLDQSGSMSGAALDQAKRAVAACLGALAPQDQFGLVAFHSAPTTFRPTLLSATDQARHEAQRFIANIKAQGGTELLGALQAAIGLLNGDRGDIFLITDGEVYETETIIAQVLQRPIRIHTLGIGVASQQRFLRQIARQTGGNSRFVQPSEPIDWTTLELFQGIGQGEPIAIRHVRCNGRPLSCEVPPPSWIQSGMPMVFYGTSQANTLQSTSDILEIQMEDGSSRKVAMEWDRENDGEFLRALTGARLIADAESQLVTATTGKKHQRQQKRLEERCRELSETYGLASRQMALVAVVEREGDRPGALPQTQVVPLGWPKEKRPEGYFGPHRMLRTDLRMLRLLALRADGGDEQDDAQFDYCAHSRYDTFENVYARAIIDDDDIYDDVDCAVYDDSEIYDGDDDGSTSDVLACARPDLDDEDALYEDEGEEETTHLSTDAVEPGAHAMPSVADSERLAGFFGSGNRQLWEQLASLCADGGVPGKDVNARVIKSVLLLLQMLRSPGKMKQILKAHIQRVVSFVRAQLPSLSQERRKLVSRILAVVDQSQVEQRVVDELSRRLSSRLSRTTVNSDEAWRALEKALTEANY